MEPSFTTISIDKEIRFWIADLEALRDFAENYEFEDSEDYRACSVSNVKYCLCIYVNKDRDDCRGESKIFLHVKIGNSIKVETDVGCLIESAGVLLNIKQIYESTTGWGQTLCSTKELFDPNKKYFVIDEMIIKLKGTLKIYLPPNETYFPFSAQWIIKKSDIEARKNSTVDEEDTCSLCCNSIAISTDPKIRYCLSFCTNGEEEHKGMAGIFFRVEFENVSKVEAIYNFTID